jgi:uncharacterized glyoxalase superfamily protein PhnB
MPSPPAERAHIIVYVRDPPAALAFWRQVLGAEPELDVPGMTEFRLASGAILGLMHDRAITRLLGPSVDPAASRGTIRAELYLVVADPAGMHARALAGGARELSPLQSRDWGDDVAYSRGPDGMVLAFARRSSP